MMPAPSASHLGHTGAVKSRASTAGRDAPVPSIRELPPLTGLSDPAAYLASHSRSFRFSAAMMPSTNRAR